MQVAVVRGDRAAVEKNVYGSQLAPQSPHSAAASVDADLDVNTLMRADLARERHLTDIIQVVR